MKKSFAPILVALASLPLTSIAQSENPRGIYKMMTLTGKQGEIPSPFDQYKICIDSISLTLTVNGNLFVIGNKERIFYTGNQPIPSDSKSMLIYDSNAEHFTLKWWSTHLNNPYFPENDWCIEKYESNKYSKIGKILFDALNGKAETSISNPLIGTWQIIGMVEEPRNKKIKQLYKDRQADTNSRQPNGYLILTPSNDILMFEKGGMVGNVEYDGKEALKKGTQTRQVKWLSKNRIALETRTNFNAGWQILERVTDGQSMMSRIMQYTGTVEYPEEAVHYEGTVIYSEEAAPEAVSPTIVENAEPDDEIWEIVEELPQYKRDKNSAAIMELMMRNLKYPQKAMEYGVEGRFIVQFVVEKDGTLSNYKIIRRFDVKSAVTVVANAPDDTDAEGCVTQEEYDAAVKALEDEAIRVIKLSSGDWTPGKQRGKAVRVKYNVPVTYRLR